MRAASAWESPEPGATDASTLERVYAPPVRGAYPNNNNNNRSNVPSPQLKLVDVSPASSTKAAARPMSSSPSSRRRPISAISPPPPVSTSKQPSPLSGGYVTIGKPVIMSAMPGQYLSASPSLPSLTLSSPGAGEDGSVVEALRKEVQALRKHEHEHEQELTKLRADLDVRDAKMSVSEDARAEKERQLEEQVQLARDKGRDETEKAQQKAHALEAKMVALRGAIEGHETTRAAKEREERVEMLYRRAMRRAMHAGLAGAWETWCEMWEARRYSLQRLRHVANRLQKPVLAAAYYEWLDTWEEERRAREAARKSLHEAGLLGARTALEAEVQRLHTEYEAKLAVAEAAKSAALDRQRIELVGSAEEVAALRAQQEKEARVELLRRQCVRRALYRELSRGWESWQEQWEARTFALQQLRRVSSRLRTPQVSMAFACWADQWHCWRESRLEAMATEATLERKSVRQQAIELSEALSSARAELTAMTRERDELAAQLASEQKIAREERKKNMDQAGREKEERVELLHRRFTRRAMQQGLASGWTAWHAMWEARRYSLQRLRHVANRLQKPVLAAAYYEWLDTWEEERRAREAARKSLHEAGLLGARTALEAEVQRLHIEYEAKLAAAEAAKSAALDRQRIELVGSAEEVAALRAQQEKEARVELLRRQCVRRALYRELSRGWESWQELWEARVHALWWLRNVGNKLRRPELATAFSVWGERWHATRERMERHNDRDEISGLSGQRTQLEAEVLRLREKAATAEEERRKRLALERELVEMSGSQSERDAVREEKEREKRVEILFRKSLRWMTHRDVANGFSAWHELWSSKTYAVGRLREISNRWRKPELSAAFELWYDLIEARRRSEELERLEMEARSTDAHLRHARFENGQLELRHVATREELSVLRGKVKQMTVDAAEKDAGLSQKAVVEDENVDLKTRLETAIEAAEAARSSQEEAEKDALKQREADKVLLQRLLDEQRRQLDDELEELRQRVAQRTAEWSKAAERRAAVEQELRVAREEIMRMQDQLAEAKKKAVQLPAKPPPVKTGPKKAGAAVDKKKGTSPLGNIDLEEGPNAKPVSEQIASAMRKNAGKVLDLFRSWDDNGDGEVTRAEFHKALVALGLDAPTEEVNKLFDEWDKGGDGALEFSELKKILSSKPTPAKEVKGAATAMMAARKLAVAAGSQSPSRRS
jgi:hypothetical protein